MSKPLIEVILTLTGHGFSPEDVTAMVTLVPTKAWRAGDLIGESKLKRKQDGWAFGLTRREAIDIEALLRQLLDAIEPFNDRIAQAANRFSLEKEIACVVYVEDETPACGITSETIRRLAALGSDLDIDLIILR